MDHRAVAGAAAAEVVALDAAREAVTLRDAYTSTRSPAANSSTVTRLTGFDAVDAGAKLADEALRLDVCFLK